MKKTKMSRLWRWCALVAPGASLMGTSCSDNVRQAVVSATLDFLENSTGTILEAVIPVEDLVGGE